MRVWTISMILPFGMATATAADLAPLTIQVPDGKIRLKDLQKVKVDPAAPRRFIEFTRGVELACPLEKGQTTQRKVNVRQSIYPIEERLRSKHGHEWLLIPALTSHQVKFGYNNPAGGTAGYAHFIAVDPSTLAIFPHEIVRYTQTWQRLDGSRWTEGQWTFGCVPTIGTMAGQPGVRALTEAEFAAVRTATEAELASAQESHNRQLAENHLREAKHHKEVLDRDRPLKSQIGASVCKLSNRILLQGFAENRSPDNGKIQIRIWRASFPENGQPSALMPTGFRESVVWDDPDNWVLCDS